MKDNQSSYSVAIIISVVFHVALLVVIGSNINFTPAKKQMKPTHQVIKAVVVSEKAVKRHAERIKRAEQDKRAKERQRQKQAEDRIKKLNEERRQKELAITNAKKQQRQAEQAAEQAEKKRLLKEDERKKSELAAVTAKAKAEKAEKAAQVADQKRKVAEKKERDRQAVIKQKKAEEAKRKAEDEIMRLAAIEQERLMQAEIEAEFASELDSEIQQLNAVRQQEVMGEVDKYRLRIKGTIKKHILTNDAMRGKSCSLEIRLSDSGFVRSVTSGKGDRLVCAAAINAVNKAGSFPMSKDPDVAAQLKLIKLSYEPEI
ncbi:MAG: colicin import membrane protein [Moritella sp.]|jgi:colicin import membrane protein